LADDVLPLDQVAGAICRRVEHRRALLRPMVQVRG
jgi:hypothetical protein